MASDTIGNAVEEQDTVSSSSGVLVSCRLRGLSPAEVSGGRQEAVHIGPLDTRSVSVTIGSTASSNTHAFPFDHVFPPSASQQEIFAAVGAPCVRDLLLGYNCTLLAYGQTGSGKTHTTIGGGNSNDDGDGLVPRMLELLFASVAQEPNTTLTASFVEVYQERLRDLLLPASSSPSSSLRIRDDKSVGGGVWVDGATEIALLDLATARAAVQRGLKHRAVGATQMNRDSSRSHAVFAVTVTRRRDAMSQSTTRARLCVVDLAGSEQAKKTRASGTRLDEAKHINRSLSALGNVIHALTSKNDASVPPSYVPYRDSKLTRLLQSSLGGNAKTHLLLTCATASCHADETLSTLRFGARAKQMQNKPTVNVKADTTAMSGQGGGAAQQQRELLATLQRKVESLCRYIRELEDAASDSVRCRCGTKSCGNDTSDSIPLELDSTEDNPASEGNGPLDDEPVSSETGMLLSSDLLMRAELVTLRRALDEMQCLQRHEQLHAQSIQDAMTTIEEHEIEKLHAQQARVIEQLEEQLTAAEREIATLHSELRGQSETQRELTRKLSQCESFVRRDESAACAETEILRRRLDQSDTLLRTLQLELVASRAETADLRLQVERSEQERVRIRAELDRTIHTQTVTTMPVTTKTLSPSPSLPVPVRSKTKPMVLRPMTVATPGASGAIQSWWAGEAASAPNNCEDDDGRRSPSAHASAICQPDSNVVSRPEDGARVRTRSSRCCTSVRRPRLDALGEDDRPPVRDVEDAEENAEHDRKQLLHTSGGARPFRARLVGLLNSLEAETSSYKELLLDTSPSSCAVDERPHTPHARTSHRRRHRLPELETCTSSTTSPLTSTHEDA